MSIVAYCINGSPLPIGKTPSQVSGQKIYGSAVGMVAAAVGAGYNTPVPGEGRRAGSKFGNPLINGWVG